VGTFDAAAKNEVRANAAAPLGPDGFVPPSLLSISAWPATFFHNGSANSLEQVMENVTHRSAGTNGVDTLSDENQRKQIVKFLRSIDSTTPPIPPQ
jgi:cytochrome c peroxidase